MCRLLQFHRARFAAMAAASLITVCLSGCTSLSDYLDNGFKVGPNYCRPNAPVAQHWIDAADLHPVDGSGIQCRWWTVFRDPKLDELILCAYRQNLTLREAGFRILQSRALRDIAIGNLFPQSQFARGAYSRNATPTGPTTPPIFSSSWNYGANLNWELDFWGRFRRAVASTEDTLEASVADYDFVLVTLLGEVATNYVTIRTTQERIDLLRANVKLQQGVFDFIDARFHAGKLSRLDRAQSLSNLRQTEAGIPVLEVTKRQAENALCVLLGIPPIDLAPMLGPGPIPVTPPEVALGIPADLLRRRPDVRKAERTAAAQAEQIGIAEADLYPAFSINGSVGYSAQFFPDLFRNSAFTGSVGPSFQWNVLNYGRIVNNVRLQDARFQELVVTYQQTVLTANEEVENGLVFFMRSQRASRLLDESVTAAKEAVEVVILQYKQGSVDFNRYATIQQNLVTQQDQAAQARGNIAQGLIQTYQALGGGWELRLCGDQPPPGAPGDGPVAPNGIEQIPLPQAMPPAAPSQPTPPQSDPPPRAIAPPQPDARQQPGVPQQQIFPQEQALPQEPLPQEPSVFRFRDPGRSVEPVSANLPAADTPWSGDVLPPNRGM